MIRAHGSSNPTAFFIADAPTKPDLESGYALTGSNAFTIQSFCKEVGLDINNFWRTCLIKEELPTQDDKEHTKTRALVDSFGSLLVDEINDLKPNLLIPMGELSFNFLTGLNSIRKFRGSVLPVSGPFNILHPNTKVLPILGPTIVNKEYKQRIVSRIDFAKITKNALNTPIPDNLYNVWVARSSAAFRTFIERHYQKTLQENRALVFDIETFAQIPICISFCFDGFESVCVPLVDSSIDRDTRALLLELVDKLLSSPIPKVNQNIKYDWKILERWGFVVKNVIGDTMLAASTLYCELPKNLGFLTSIYTDLPYFKDEGKMFDPDKSKRDRYYLYNAKDSLATSQIYTQQIVETEELGVDWIYNQLIKVMPIYRRMEDRGILIDEMQRIKLLAKYESLYRIQILKCRKLLNVQYFNPNSRTQLDWAVWEELGYEKVRGMKTSEETGRIKLDEEGLELLSVWGEAKRAPSTGPYVLASIIGARKIHKVIEILELQLHPDGRFRGEYNLAGTETGRTSSGETTDQYLALDGESGKLIIGDKGNLPNLGHSLQTIGKHGFSIDGITYGKDLRSMFIPSPGYVFVECDLSGAEARVDRVLSGVYDMDIFDNPGIHKLTGSWVYDCKPEDIKKNILVDGVDRYHMSKIIRHAGERNIREDRLAMMTQRPIKECKSLLETFHKFQPEIKETFHKDIIKAIDETHSLIAPNGRRRDFFDRIDKETYNKGISQLPQAIVSDQTKFHGIGKTFHDTNIYKWAHLLVEAHDGILAEVIEDRALEFGLFYKTNVESEPIDFRRGSLPRPFQLTIPCEISISKTNWLEMEDVK